MALLRCWLLDRCAHRCHSQLIVQGLYGRDLRLFFGNRDSHYANAGVARKREGLGALGNVQAIDEEVAVGVGLVESVCGVMVRGIPGQCSGFDEALA